MNLRELQKLITKAAKSAYDNESFAVGVLAARASKLAEVYSTDYTVVNMSNFLNKRASGNSQLITRSELKEVYNKLYSRNTKFAEHFTDELGLVEAAQTASVLRNPNEGKDLVAEAYEKMADPILSNALKSVFDKSEPYKPYSLEAAKKAQKACAHVLNTLGLPPKTVDVVAGQPDLLLCSASYETPSGQSHVLVPVELKQSLALLPTVFLSSEGCSDLTNTALQNHLVVTAGKKQTVNVAKVLQALSLAKNGLPEVMSEVELVLAKAAAGQGISAAFAMNAVTGQEVNAPSEEVSQVQQPLTGEAQAIATRLASAPGAAEFLFGKKPIEMGRNLIVRKLAGFGFKNVQVAVGEVVDNHVVFAASVNGQAGFNVPVKIAADKIEDPTVVLSQGGLYDFSAEGVSEILQNNSDNVAMAKASPMYGLKPSELVSELKAALAAQNLVKAEDALSVLRLAGDEKAYKVGFELYTKALSGSNIEKQACTAPTCTKQMKMPNSTHIICGHTQLPLHKVYQDKRGECQPLYRKAMDESYEGAAYLTSKILLS